MSDNIGYRSVRGKLLGTTAMAGACAVVLTVGVVRPADAATILGAVTTNVAVTATASGVIVERGSPQDTDTGELDIQGNETLGQNANNSINLDTNSGKIFIFATGSGDTLTIDGDISIVAGETLTLAIGDDEDSQSGAAGVITLFVNDGSNADIFIGGANSSTRGGNVIIENVDGQAFGTHVVSLEADITLDTLTLSAGDGGGANGDPINITIGGGDIADDIDVTGLVVNGGAGSSDKTGGTNTVLMTGTLAVGATGIDINGGAAGVTGAGGNVQVTLSQAITTLTGAVAIDGGDAGTVSGAGGTAELETDGAVTSTSAWTVTGGDGASAAGTGDGGIATLDADAAFTTSSTVTFIGGAAGVGTTPAANGGQATGAFATTIDVLGLTITGVAGGANDANVGGAAAVTVTGVATIGASGITINAGKGGTFAGAATGGTSSLTVNGATTITGDISVVGGAGEADDDADGGAATLAFTGDVTATSQTLTITGGSGDVDDDGDGGAATVTFEGGGTFTSVVLNDGTAGSATGGAATLLFNAAASKVFTGAITASLDNEGTISIENSNTTGLRFASTVGASGTDIATINVGRTTQEGNANFDEAVFATTINIGAAQNMSGTDGSSAIFDKTVGATTVNITGGTGGQVEPATATFTGTPTITTLNLISGTNDNGSDVTATFTSATVAVTTITLDGLSAAREANIVFSGAVAQTTSATFDGVGGAEGNINVVAGTNLVTLSGAVGGTTGLRSVNIGVDGTAGANALFSSTVQATNIKVDAESGVATANFDGAVIGAINIEAGTSADEDASASFAGTVTGAITLTADGDTTGIATMTIDGTGAQTFAGAITGATATDGTINITNTGGLVSFTTGAISGRPTMTMASSSSVDFSQDVTVATITGGGSINFSVSKELQADTDIGASGAPFTISVDAGVDIILDGAADGTVFATVTLDGASSDVSLGTTADMAFTGDIIAGVAGEGEVEIIGQNGTATITGNIGASGANVDKLVGTRGYTISGSVFADTISGAVAGGGNFDGSVTSTTITSGAGDLLFAADISATAIVLASGADMTIDGAVNQAIGGTINGDGVLTITNTAGGVATFAGKIGGSTGVNDLVVSANASVQFEDTVVITDELTLTDGATIIVGSGITAGTDTLFTTTSGGGITDNDGVADITVKLPANFTSGTLDFINDTAADISTNFTDEYAIRDTALVDYSIAAGSDATILAITASAKSAATTAAELGINVNEATQLSRANTAVAGDQTALDAMTAALNAGGTTAKKAAQTVGVQADSLGASNAVASAVSGTVSAISTTRLASLRDGPAYAANTAGFSAGNGMASSHYWFRPFGTLVSQDASGGVAGYDASTAGVVAGFDIPMGRSQNTNIGFSVSYAGTNVDGDGAGDAQSDIVGYGVNVYADFSNANAYFQLLAGYGWNQNDTSRTISIGTLSRTAKGNFDSQQYTVMASAGVPRRIAGNSFLTPSIGVSHTSVASDSYTETGAGTLNQTVNQADTDVTLGAVGLRWHSVLNRGSGNSLVPELRTSLQYDFASDEAEATATFAGGGAAFTTTGAEVQSLGVNVGAGVTWNAAGSSLSISYDAGLKSDYLSHTGAAELRVSF